MDYTEYAMHYGPEAADRAVAEQQAKSNHAGEAAGERAYRLIAEAGFSEWIDWEAWARQSGRTDTQARDLRNWFTDKPPEPKTITLAAGEYWWRGTAPKFRLHPHVYSDIINIMRQFEKQSGWPQRIDASLTTMQALGDMATPRTVIDPANPQCRIFGIPLVPVNGMTTGVIRMCREGAVLEVQLREAATDYAWKD